MTNQQSKKPNYGLFTEYFDQDLISFTDVILILARQFKVIIITPTILCTLTIIYVMFIAKPIFTSTSKIMSSSGGGGSGVVGLAAQFGINLTSNQSEPNWINPTIIKSRTLARSMLKRKFDTEEFGPKKSLLQILTYGNNEPKYSLDTLETMAVDNLIKKIGVSEEIRTGIFTINIHISEPQLAAELNNVLIEELDARQREYNKSKTGETRKFIEERIIDTEKELQISEDALRDFATRNRHIENSPLLLLEQQRLAREVTVLMGVFTTLKQQLETTKIEEVKDSDYVVVLDPPETPLQRSKPKKKLLVFWAGIIGIGLGVLIALLRDFFTNTDNEKKDKLGEARSLFLKNFSQLFFVRSKKST